MSQRLREVIEKFDNNGWDIKQEKIDVNTYVVYASCSKGNVKLGKYIVA